MAVQRRVNRAPGPPPLSGKRTRFMLLVGRGMSNAEACRVVGVNRRTGSRWLHGRVFRDGRGVAREYAPVSAPEPRPLSDRYLSQDERTVIADGLRAGWSIRRIAGQLQRSPSTVSREVRRNAAEEGRYTPYAAHRRAMDRLPRPRPRKVAQDPDLLRVVQGWLDKRWSPEQISASMRRRYRDQASWHLATETIYQSLYDPSTPLQRSGEQCLRTRRSRRRPRRHPMARAARPGKMLPVDQRPAGAADRTEAGHWESQCTCQAVFSSAVAGST
jgi:IS30 family transposase